jgi:hypothetical protein
MHDRPFLDPTGALLIGGAGGKASLSMQCGGMVERDYAVARVVMTQT